MKTSKPSTRWGSLSETSTLVNYRDGKLVDFSRAFTLYHPGLDRPVEYLMERCKFEEGMNLLETIEDGGSASEASRVEIPRGLIRYLEGDLGIDPR